MVIPYALQLAKTWRSSNHCFKQRVGWLVATTTAEGLAGYGDCAPLPSMGTETISQAEQILLDTWCHNRAMAPHQWVTHPAACSAMETAILDLEARQARIPLAKHLNPSAVDSVIVNAVASLEQPEQIYSLERQGYTVIKLKVGLKSVEQELTALAGIASGLDCARLRLDANGAWDQGTAKRFIQACAHLPVESLEEPLQHPTLASLCTLQKLAKFPLAVDESLDQLGVEVLAESACIKRIIIKPQLRGGPSRSFRLAEYVVRSGMQPVVTTMVESAAGVWAAVQLAAAIDPLCPGLHHGLSTSSWLERDTGIAPVVHEGRIELSHRPGTGFQLNG